MATRQENLDTALDQIAELIVSITANPKPDYNVGGRSVSWGSYLSMLIQQQEALYKAKVLAGSDGPTFQVTSRGEV